MLLELVLAGVPVRVLVAAGCQPQWFHPRRLRNLGLQNERDLAHCTELEAGSWARRGRWHRWRDRASYLLQYQL